MTHNTLSDPDSTPPQQSIPERFEEIVARYPDRLAVKLAARSLSYCELNEASNRIAHRLLTITNSPNASVALLFGHGINVIIAMMGTLKAGKQACALDLNAPEERMQFILNDCQ